MALPVQREVLLDKEYHLRKAFDCGSDNCHTETFAVFDKKALPHIKRLMDNESDANVRNQMENIYCLQMFEYATNGDYKEPIQTYRNKAFVKITRELDNHATNGYIGIQGALWYHAYVTVQREDAEVITISKKAMSSIQTYTGIWREISMKEDMREVVDMNYNECHEVEECFKDLNKYGKCFYNENVISILNSNSIKYILNTIDNFRKEFAKKLLGLKKKLHNGLSMANLIMFQRLPLVLKMGKTAIRIREWYEHWDGQVYISFSGGKDSTVLALEVRKQYPHVPAVFIDTGLEDPRVREFALNFPNTIVIKPKLSFRQVIKKYGYPVISKSQAMAIRKLTTQNLTTQYKNKLLHGDERGQTGMLASKWHYLLDAPFKISEKCCDVMKKSPAHAFEKMTGLKPFIGSMASESPNRQIAYLEYGCNAFDKNHPGSTPMGFWTDQDILKYIKDYNVSIASAYGDVVEENGVYRTTKERRTGCLWCGFGVQMEPKDNNRFLRMATDLPDMYKYCMEKLDMDIVLNYLGVNYIPAV